MTDDYPVVPAELIVSGSNNTDAAMTSDLDQFLKKDQADKSLVGNAMAAKHWLEHNGILPAVALPQSVKKARMKKTRKTAENDQSTSTPKKKMRTASDVIKRIQWQEELKSEDFTVGYLDRFLGMQEKEFGAFSWDDIAAVDDYAVLSIPKHRIQYFKYRGMVIWDKTLRLDNVFGSTGSGITLLSLLGDADSNSSGVLDTSGQQAECVCVPDNGEDASSEEQSDDEEDGVLVTVASSQKTEPIPSSKAKPQQLKSPLIPPLPQRQQRGGRPNYFLCQRITSPAIVKGILEVQSMIAKAAPAFSSCFSDPTSLHITLCTLALNDESQVIIFCC